MSPPVRVLIADDHDLVREGLRTFLAEARESIEVVGEARDGEEAVRLAERLRPDVVLMDLVMPRLDGIEATRRLCESPDPPRVLVLTTFGEGARVRDAIRAGATGFLLKDVVKSQLVQAIRNAAHGTPTLHPLAQRQLMKEVAEPETSPFRTLTARELDVMRRIARGESNKVIAAELGLSLGTVKSYTSAIFRKLGVADRTQAALLAVRHRLG